MMATLLAAPVASAAGPAATAPAPAPPAASADAAPPAAPPTFAPLAIPDWVILEHGAGAESRPWILIVDDPQCPYCMQLHLALTKAREMKDPEISGAVIARLPFPLAYHDQSAHIVSDAYCLEASSKTRPWSAASYLDWLIVDPWRAEKEWASVTYEDLEKDNGFFDSKYEAHKVTSSRRREYQTQAARAEAACSPDSCRGDEDCVKLCAAQTACRSKCAPAAGPGPGAPRGGVSEGQGSGGAIPAPASEREACLKACTDTFVSSRYRQYSKVHSDCLLEEGPGSAHGRTAASFAWARDNKIGGTPTVYVGHPRIGFRTLGDSDHLADFLVLLREGLAQARSRLSATAQAAPPSSPAR